MEVDYYSKYLKYKEKYLKLKAQLGGLDYQECRGSIPVYCNGNLKCKHPCGVIGCNSCYEFIHDTTTKNKCKTCGHEVDDHYACD